MIHEQTLEAWIKADEFVGDSGIIGKWDDADDNRSYKLYVDSSAKLNLLLSSDGTATTVVTLTGNTDVPMEEWVHVAAARQGDQIRLYVNEAVQTTTGTFTGAVHDGSASLLVGDGFDGAIDEVQISKADNSGSLNYVDVRYVPNERNQIATETSGESIKTYAYDKNGNTTDIVESVDLNDDDIGDAEVSNVHMEYDQLNRMLSYAGPEGTESFSYRGAEWHRFSANNTGFLYDGDNVAADIEGGSVTRTYVTPFLDQNLSMTIHGTTPATYYYSQDGLGSVRTLTDGAGGVRNRHDYLPFGGPSTPDTHVNVAQRYNYTAREENSTSSLMVYRYRTYNPRAGRFLSRDPWWQTTDVSMYNYVWGAATMYVDPTGLSGCSAVLGPFIDRVKGRAGGGGEPGKAISDATGITGNLGMASDAASGGYARATSAAGPQGGMPASTGPNPGRITVNMTSGTRHSATGPSGRYVSSQELRGQIARTTSSGPRIPSPSGMQIAASAGANVLANAAATYGYSMYFEAGSQMAKDRGMKTFLCNSVVLESAAKMDPNAYCPRQLLIASGGGVFSARLRVKSRKECYWTITYTYCDDDDNTQVDELDSCDVGDSCDCPCP